MKRREFIILTSTGAASATLLSACGHPENKLIPVFIPDEEYVPGLDYWKASVCGMCPAGCGILVRTRERKANKIEGNPLHPINRGALCARGQAGLQVLYNPDRIKGPMKRAGERDSGQFSPITWDEAIKTLAGKMREIKSAGRAGSAVFVTDDASGVTGLVAGRLMTAYGSKLLVEAGGFLEPAEASGYLASYGRAEVPQFDIANATYLLSFGARFLETWHSPVRYSLAYAEFRQPRNRARGKFVQVEPRMSLTAANADEWLPAAIGAEGLVALAIAQVITREGLAKVAAAPLPIGGSLDDCSPERTAERTDIAADKLIGIAREFAAAERPLAIAGGAALTGSGGSNNLRAINYLNALAGNIGASGGVLLSEGGDFDAFADLRSGAAAEWGRKSWGEIIDAKPEALLIHNSNPAYTHLTLADKIESVPFIASFSPFMDETTRLADLILPDHTYLERWNIKTVAAGGKQSAVAIIQPVVKAEFDTKQTADALIALGSELDAGIEFESAESLVARAAKGLQKANGSIAEEDADEYLKAFIERGVWVGEVETRSDDAKARAHPSLRPTAVSPFAVEQNGDGSFPLKLLAYEHAALGRGEQANLPWLQELPDPMTSVCWGSWVEINPRTASQYGIADGDLVEVTSAHGSVRAPAVVY
ncbi:MAG TPA: molybdopterin-dependent oxidoreductase, partial [Blastocatellia bacterium]|nr:molybdopterin-dependent oxidoreductase [Blastocatellia bacterium]